jgi:hypothetical protein
MKRWLFLLLVIPLVACSAQPQSQAELSISVERVSHLPDLGEAPELTNDVWLNSDGSLRLVDLRGQVVLLDMWTFG